MEADRQIHREFDLFRDPVLPRMMLEASAGSGKTWMLTGLYVRLLLEKDVSVENLLVLTYTNFATKELKDRIQKRLRESLNALESGDAGDDPFLKQLIEHYGENREAAGRLQEALGELDRSVIVTIHGFCQQILSEETLMTGAPFDFDVDSDEELLQLAAEDEWRSFLNRHSSIDEGRTLLNALEKEVKSPEELIHRARIFRNAGTEQIVNTEEDDPELLFTELTERWKSLRRQWMDRRGEILELLSKAPLHKGHILNHLPKWAETADGWPESLPVFDEKLLIPVLRLNTSNILEKTNNNQTPPEHRFFDRCEEFKELLERVEPALAVLQLRLVRNVLESREKLAQEGARLDYQDLLDRVRQAVCESPQANRLSSHLLKRFPFALVDEFQDTDTHQYEIFSAIWPAGGSGHSLVMVGDPKQAIYSFRGGDIYTYLLARSETGDAGRYSLPCNYRSRPLLVEAVNRLFSPGHGAGFLEESIPYLPVRSGEEEREEGYRIEGQPPPPFSLTVTTDNSEKGPSGIYSDESIQTAGKDGRHWREVARQVRELLDRGSRGEAVVPDEEAGGTRALQGGDIAILYSNHHQGDGIRRELARLGVRSVGARKENIFESREADILIRLFRAILDETDPASFRDLIITGLMGQELEEILGIFTEERTWISWQERLVELHDMWIRYGTYPMLRYFLFSDRRITKMAWWDSGERMLANLEQLAELISDYETGEEAAPRAVLDWLLRRRQEESRNEENLYLESDEQLVRLMTLHSSKGLEFPVVFCPTLWYARKRKKGLMEIFHESSPPFRFRMCLGSRDSGEMKEAWLRSRFEEVAEEVRKCYVAVTRAKYECRIFLKQGKYSTFSGLAAMLRGPRQVRKDLEQGLKVGESKNNISFDQLWEPLFRLTAAYPQLFRIIDAETTLPDTDRADVSAAGHMPSDQQAEQREESDTKWNEGGAEKPAVVDGDPASRPYRGPRFLLPAVRRYNFTALAHPATGTGDGRDYDHLPATTGIEPYDSKPGKGQERHSMFNFPRGARAGTFIHKLFEDPAFDFRSRETDTEIVSRLSTRYGFDSGWQQVLEGMLRSVAEADYGELNLNRVPPRDMLREMEFHFSVPEVPADTLYRIIRDSGKAFRDMREDLSGVMNGFIDLVLRYNSRYYIMDYKSNWLGSDPDSYRREELNREMVRSGYDLQYHIYLMALTKYLRSRDPNFSYDGSIGGVFYLFVRGMQPNDSNGIYFDRPSRERMNELEKIWSRRDE